MNRRALLVLLLIFAGLGIIALLQNQPPPESTIAELRATATVLGTPMFLRVYPEMAVLDIQAIRLRDPNSDLKFTIARGTDGKWTAPDAGTDVSLDTDAASIVAQSVVLLHYERTLPLAEDTKLTDYGFDPHGWLFIEVVLNTGATHAVAIGRLSNSREFYYALVDERQEIYLLERGPVDYLLMQLSEPPLT